MEDLRFSAVDQNPKDISSPKAQNLPRISMRNIERDMQDKEKSLVLNDKTTGKRNHNAT